MVRGRCLSYGEGITFWPLVEIVRDVVGADPGDLASSIEALLREDASASEVATRVAQLVGGQTGLALPAEEVGWAVRRFLEGLARAKPLVVVLDDLLGRVQPARPRGSSHRLEPGHADPGDLHGEAGSAGPPVGLGRREAPRDHGRAGAPDAPGSRAARGEPGQRRRRLRACADRRRRRGQPAVRGGDGCDAGRRWGDPARGRSLGRGVGSPTGFGPADDPGSAGRPSGSAERRRARTPRARCGGGTGLLPGCGSPARCRRRAERYRPIGPAVGPTRPGPSDRVRPCG